MQGRWMKMPHRRKMPNVNIDTVTKDLNSQNLFHFIPPSDDGKKSGKEPGDELVPLAMAFQSQLLALAYPNKSM